MSVTPDALGQVTLRPANRDAALADKFNAICVLNVPRNQAERKGHAVDLR